MISPDSGRDATQEGGDLVTQCLLVVEGAKDDGGLGAGGDEHGVGEGGRLVGAFHNHHISQRQDHPHQARYLRGRHTRWWRTYRQREGLPHWVTPPSAPNPARPELDKLLKP